MVMRSVRDSSELSDSSSSYETVQSKAVDESTSEITCILTSSSSSCHQGAYEQHVAMSSSNESIQNSLPEEGCSSTCESDEDNNFRSDRAGLVCPVSASSSILNGDQSSFHPENNLTFEQSEDNAHPVAFTDSREWMDSGMSYLGSSLVTIPENQILNTVSEIPVHDSIVEEMNNHELEPLSEQEEMQDCQSRAKEGEDNSHNIYYPKNQVNIEK